jgi:hypothetical protein
MSTWQSYGVRAWPTLVLVDPLGEIIATYSGEGHAHAIDALLQQLVPEYEASGNLTRGKGVYLAPTPSSLALKQPGKIVAVPTRYQGLLGGAELLVSNSGGHNLVGLKTSNLIDPVATIGKGSRGGADGDYLNASFAEPYGAVFLDDDVATKVGAHLIVADTANHLIRAINLETQDVFTLAGTGNQWMQKDETTGPALSVNISTPWDIEVFEEQLLIGMSGEHRIWAYDFDTKNLGIFAGTTNEGLVDGSYADAWFAQPSALVGSKNQPGKVWLIDAETSALRTLENGEVSSQVGKGLFDFGHLDGPADQALLQHPLGLLELPDGSILIADTYNGAIRKYSPDTNSVSTIARALMEPSDLELVETESGPRLAVVETSANRISLLPIEEGSLIQGAAMRTARPALEVTAGELVINVTFSAPPGQKLDERYGPSSFLVVSSTPKELLIEGAGNSQELTRKIVLNPAITEGVLHVAAKGASCDESEEGAQCHIHQQDWGIPVKVTSTGVGSVELVLSGNKG